MFFHVISRNLKVKMFISNLNVESHQDVSIGNCHTLCVCVCVCVCVCARARARACACVCETEREREREKIYFLGFFFSAHC
jgi:hypothetical protein